MCGLRVAVRAGGSTAIAPQSITMWRRGRSNRPASSLKPDAYVCSPGSTLPAAAVLPISDRYDGTMLLPTPMEFAVPDLHIPAAEGAGPAACSVCRVEYKWYRNLCGLPIHHGGICNERSGPQSSVLLVEFRYKLWQPIQDSHDAGRQGNSNAEYALGAANPMKPISNLQPAGIYFFVNNQTWPLSGAAGSMQTQRRALWRKPKGH